MIPVVISDLAERDLTDITDYYLIEAGVEVTSNFLANWDRATRQIGEFPQSGSPRLAEPLDMPNLRVWPIRGFPHSAIYLVEAERIVVVRVLHTARDIEPLLK